MGEAFYTRDFFKPALIASFSIHGLLIAGSIFMPAPAQYSVIKAPSSMEVIMIKEPVIKVEPVIEPPKIEPIKQEVVETIAIEEPIVEEIVEEVQKKETIVVEVKPIVVKKPKKIVKRKPKEKPIQVIENPSQGAIVEAKPSTAVINPSPLYPKRARRRGWEGLVELRVLVTRDGRADEIRVEKSSGYALLDEEAVKTVKTWQFTAAKRGKMRFTSWITVPIRFKLVD